MNYKIKKLIAVMLATIVVSCIITMFMLWLASPEKSQMRLLIDYWYIWAIGCVSGALAYFVAEEKGDVVETESGISFRLKKRRLSQYQGYANLYELSEKVEYNVSIYPSFTSFVDILKYGIKPKRIDRRQTKYIIVWVHGCIEMSEYTIYPATSWGRTRRNGLLYTKESVENIKFEDIIREFLNNYKKEKK